MRAAAAAQNLDGAAGALPSAASLRRRSEPGAASFRSMKSSSDSGHSAAAINDHGNDSHASSSEGSDGSSDEAGNGVLRAQRLARQRSMAKLRAQSARRQSAAGAGRSGLPALLSSHFGGVSDLGALASEQEVGPEAMRKMVATERAREAVRATLVERGMLMDPSAVGRPEAGAAATSPHGARQGSQTGMLQPSARRAGAGVSLPPASSLHHSASRQSMDGPPPLQREASSSSQSCPLPQISPMAAAAQRRRSRLLTHVSPAERHAQEELGTITGTLAGRKASGPGAPHLSPTHLSHARSGCLASMSRYNSAPCDSMLAELADDASGEADMESLVADERRRLARVQSKVSTALRKSRPRAIGLLAHAASHAGRRSSSGGEEEEEEDGGDAVTAAPSAHSRSSVAGSASASVSFSALAPAHSRLHAVDPDELTRAIVAAPALPSNGAELKVPVDDIRFSGIKLRFLMALLQALEDHPALCTSTTELVQALVVPLTAGPKCRLLDLVPVQHRGQPHHYICHAWGCSAHDMLACLRREMLPVQPPPPPPPPKPPGASKDEKPLGRQQRCAQPAATRPAAADAPRPSLPSLSSPSSDKLPQLHGRGSGPDKGGGGAAAHAGGGGSGALPSIGRPSGAGAQPSGASACGLEADPYAGLTSEARFRQYDVLAERYQSELDVALEQVVWLDWVCHNQHSAVKKDYAKVAKTVVACGATVVVMDAKMTPLQRTWCLYEIMHCLRCKRHLKVFHMDGTSLPDEVAAKAIAGINIQNSKATSDEDRVGILQEVLNTVGSAYVNDVIRKAMHLSNTDRARQLALRREQLAVTMKLLDPDPATISTEQYERNLAECRAHLEAVLTGFYPEEVLRCIIPQGYVSDSARVWDLLRIFADILECELFRTDAKALRHAAWLLFKRHSKRYIEVLYEKELDNWLLNSLEHDRKWRRVQAKLKLDGQKKWN